MKTKYDIIIVGGGFAGATAAIAAAKRGKDVLLIEKYNALGGAAINCLVMPFMGYFAIVDGKREALCGSIFEDIVNEMNRFLSENKLTEFDEEVLKLVLNRMTLKYGVNLLFDTTVTDVRTDNGTITSITVLGKSTIMEFTADVFIDATGDAEFSMLAGCKYNVGREGDSLCQPMTLCFRVGGVDKKKYAENREKINPLYKEFQEKGLISNPREDVLIFDNFNDGVLHFNSTRIVKKNPTNPFEVTEAEIEAREQVFELHKFLKDNIPGFENSRVLSTALQIGIRESRKIVGEYTITKEDLVNLARFDDAIAVANYDKSTGKSWLSWNIYWNAHGLKELCILSKT